MENLISSATIKPPEQSGTQFYIISVDDIKRAYGDSNIVLRYLLDVYGLNIYNVQDMYGSAIIDGDLVLCVTDGYDIEVEGQEIYPEDALDDFGLSGVEPYIVEDVPDDIIRRYLSNYEILADIDDVVLEMLESTSYTLYQILGAAEDLDLFDPNLI